MRRNSIRQIIFPLLTSFLWGSSFVAKSLGSGFIGCFSFNWTRSVIAALALLPLLKFMGRKEKAEGCQPETTGDPMDVVRGGLVVGTVLMLANNIQQYGMQWTSAGKAGFITALYIVIVPALGVFFHKRVRALVWCGIALSVAGLYCLFFDGGDLLSFSRGDVSILIGAFGFAGHILSVDYFTNVKKVDGVKLSFAQFVVVAAESFICAALFEGFPMEQIWLCMPYLLYSGILAGGVGYTLQILAQAEGDPVIVSLLLGLESFFAAVCGAVVLRERMSLREYIGCALMLCAVVLVQLPEKKREAAAQKSE